MNNAFQIARSMIGMEESGSNSGEVVERVMGENMVGQPWCAGFVTYCFTAGGQDAWMEGMSNRFAVDSVMQHGRDKGLNSNLSEGARPQVGSLLEFKEWPHIGMVSRVEIENGETVYYVTHGNYSDKVVEERFTESDLAEKFHDNFVDSAKIDTYHASLNRNIPPLTGTSPQQIQTAAQNYQQFPTPQQVQNTLQQNNGNATNTYDQMMGLFGGQNGMGDMGSMLMPLLVMMILAAVGEQDMAPSHDEYRQNPNVGRERLQQYDRNQQQNIGREDIVAENVTEREALTAPPSVTPPRPAPVLSTSELSL